MDDKWKVNSETYHLTSEKQVKTVYRSSTSILYFNARSIINMPTLVQLLRLIILTWHALWKPGWMLTLLIMRLVFKATKCTGLTGTSVEVVS